MRKKFQFCFTLSQEVADYLKSESEKTGIKMSTLVERAIINLKKEKNGN